MREIGQQLEDHEAGQALFPCLKASGQKNKGGWSESKIHLIAYIVLKKMSSGPRYLSRNDLGRLLARVKVDLGARVSLGIVFFECALDIARGWLPDFVQFIGQNHGIKYGVDCAQAGVRKHLWGDQN